MKQLALILFCVICVNAIPVKQSEYKKPFEFSDVVPNRFSFRGFNGTWISSKLKTVIIFYIS